MRIEHPGVCMGGRRNSHPMQVVDRVRDHLFVIDLSVKDPSITQNVLREKARTTAERVAGNLF